MSNIIANARLLRKNQTDAGEILWDALRGKQFLGLKFRRQHVFDAYIVDFVCIKIKLIIEVDGINHQQQTEYDAMRTQHLKSLGYRVIRFTNHDVMNNTNKILHKLAKYIKSPSPPNL